MNNHICPICGKENTLEKVKIPYKVTIGTGESSQDITNYKCANCGFEGDIDFENEKIIKKTVSMARQNCVSEILNNFDKSFQLADIERAFSLPPRTLSKWKNKAKSPSASATALVRLLKVFPWLIYIGMCDFNTQIAYRIAGKAITNRILCDNNINGFYEESDNYKIIGIISTVNNKNFTDKIDYDPSPYRLK